MKKLKKLASLSDPVPSKMSCKLSPIVRTERISRICGLDEIRTMPDVVDIRPSYNEGDMFTGDGTLKQVVCRFYIISGIGSQLKDSIDRILKLFHVYDDKGEEMLTGLFDNSVMDKAY